MEILEKTIGQMFDEVAESYPNNEALVHTEIGIRYNYALLSWEMARAAKGLLEIGIQKGDRVAIYAPNIPEWVVAQGALAKTGAIMVPVDPGASGEELYYILDQSGANALIMAQGLDADEYVEALSSIKDRVPALEHTIVSGTKTYPETIPWSELTAMGEGVAQDQRKAAVLFQKACDGGAAEGCFNLGVMYANGEGVNQDLDEGIKWLRRAAAQGDRVAKDNLVTLGVR